MRIRSTNRLYAYQGNVPGFTELAKAADKAKRPASALGLIALMLFTLACPRTQVQDNAQFILDSLTAVAALWPAKAATINKGLGVGQKILDSVKANNATDAVAFIEQEIPVARELLNDASLIPDAGTRAAIMIALSGLDIGLHFLARFYKANAPALSHVPGATRDSIFSFDAEPVRTPYKSHAQLKAESAALRKK